MEQGCRWLSDYIGEDYKTWSVKDAKDPLKLPTRVYIESPTGTGKTSFIIDNLWPYAAQLGRNILYISNRTALEVQTKLKMLGLEDVHGVLDNTDLSEAKTFRYPNSAGEVTVINYQAVFSLMKYLGGSNPFYYVVLDESHFFYEDSMFNSRTYLIFDRMLRQFSQSVLVFMSATLDDYVEVYEKEQEKYLLVHPQGILHKAMSKSDVRRYRNLFRKDVYNPIFYFEDTEIVKRINETPPNEKWLIFVSSKQRGISLRKNLQQATKRTVRFLSAEKKSSALWKQVVETSCFKAKILITTTVLDNGINIKDPMVKHVVLPFCDRVEFMQMLGRRRLQGEEKLAVYVKIPTIQSINAQRRQIKRKLAAISEVNQVENELRGIKEAMKLAISAHSMEYVESYKEIERKLWEKKTEILQRYWTRGDQSINTLFYIDYSRCLAPNPFAYRKLLLLKAFYEQFADNSRDFDCCQQQVLSWLNIPTNRTEHLSVKSATTLPVLLRTYTDIPIAEDEQEKFYQAFQLLYRSHCIQFFEKDSDDLKAALSVRKGTTQRKGAMNRQLKKIGQPYKVVKRDKYWIVQEIPSD